MSSLQYISFFRHWFPAFCLLGFLLPTPFFVTACLSDELDRLREEAVTSARDGDLSSGINTLERLYRGNPDDIKIHSDLAVLYIWQGSYAKGLELFEHLQPTAYPPYVLKAVITGYRSLGESEKAIPLVDMLLEKNPQDLEVLIRKSQLLVDTERYAEAEALLSDLQKSSVNRVDVLRVEGYLYAELEEWITVLLKYQDILEDIPDDPEALRGQVYALLHLGAPWAAVSQMAGTVGDPGSQDLAAVMQAQAAVLLRWSSHASHDTAEAVAYAQRAYNLLEDAEKTVAKVHEKELLRGIAYDKVVALTNLQQYETAYELYLTLVDEGGVPPYVSLAAAQSLLAMQEPELARKLLETTFGAVPAGRQEALTLFYSCIETEDYQRAYDIIDELVRITPKFKRFSDSTEQYDNDEAFGAAVVASQARLYGDQLEDAWGMAIGLQNEAPANSWLNNTVGQVASARQWPRIAFNSYQQAFNLNPQNHNAREGMAQSLIAQHEYSQAEAVLTEMKDKYPLELSTRRLEKDLLWARRPDLWADFEYSYSDSPEQAGDSILLTGEVISSPISDSLHVSAQVRYAWSELPEGSESFSRFGAGLEYIGRPFSLLALVNYNDSSIEEMGGVLRGIWSPDDHWTVVVQGELFSDATPLRALFHEIREDRVTGAFTYRWSESRSLNGGINYGWFTDDNERLEVNLGYSQRVADIPRFDLDAGIGIYGSTNSEVNTPYFNPESDLSIKGVIKAEHLLFRFYEKSFVQYVEAGAGMYSQENYSSGFIGHVRYDLRYKYHPRIEASLGGEIGQSRYDGENEPYYKLRLQAHVTF